MIESGSVLIFLWKRFGGEFKEKHEGAETPPGDNHCSRHHCVAVLEILWHFFLFLALLSCTSTQPRPQFTLQICLLASSSGLESMPD